MEEAQQGYLVWKKQNENYVFANEEQQVIQPVTPLRISEVIKEQRPQILQIIWCKKVGFINRDIGKSEELDKKIAQELEIW